MNNNMTAKFVVIYFLNMQIISNIALKLQN